MVVRWDHGAGRRRAGCVHRQAGAAASPPAPDQRRGPAADEALAGPSRAAERAVRLPCLMYAGLHGTMIDKSVSGMGEFNTLYRKGQPEFGRPPGPGQLHPASFRGGCLHAVRIVAPAYTAAARRAAAARRGAGVALNGPPPGARHRWPPGPAGPRGPGPLGPGFCYSRSGSSSPRRRCSLDPQKSSPAV